jgi:hypothetical protein
MSGVLFYLLINPNTLNNLSREVRGAYKTARDIDIASTLKLPYLQAVLREAMRIFPVVPQGPPRRSPGTVIEGYYVPEGVSQTRSSLSNRRLMLRRPRCMSLHGQSLTMHVIFTSHMTLDQSAGLIQGARIPNKQANHSHSDLVCVQGSGEQADVSVIQLLTTLGLLIHRCRFN